MTPAFRKMQLADLPDVLHNERSGYDWPWSEGVFRDCLRNGEECWLAVRDDRIIGHGVISVAAGESHLLNVCIHPEHQGGGAGRAMVEHLLECARQLQATIMFLEVRISNLVACGLYESLGFNEVGVRKNYYPGRRGREDALVFAKELRP